MSGKWAICHCDRCGRDFISATPSSVRFSIGRAVMCCDRVATFVRYATEEESKLHEKGLFKGRIVHGKAEKVKYQNPYAKQGVGKHLRRRSDK